MHGLLAEDENVARTFILAMLQQSGYLLVCAPEDAKSDGGALARRLFAEPVERGEARFAVTADRLRPSVRHPSAARPAHAALRHDARGPRRAGVPGSAAATSPRAASCSTGSP